VRIVQTNAMDLNLFQFDNDLTFAAFFLNADKTIYGRFGSRSSQKDAQSDISLEGFKRSLEVALEVHAEFPKNREALAGKRGSKVRYARPELYPELKRFKPTLDYSGKVASTSVHCHMIRTAENKVLRGFRKPLPEKDLFPWPMPRVVGLEMDPESAATVLSVKKGSAAADAGFRKGDSITHADGQPIVSVADIQWVLHESGSRASLPVVVKRSGKRRNLTLELEKGWRRADDLSWRTTSWDFRRMATGGMLLTEIEPAKRRQLRLKKDRLALFVKHVGQYGDHATAKRAGFKKGDIIVDWDGETKRLSETEIFTRGIQHHKIGDKIPVTVVRNGKRKKLELTMK